MDRANLSVQTYCQVQRIVVSGGRATGVDYIQKGQQLTAQADQEVLVTSGAIGSPKLMLLSGIGPAAHLRDVGGMWCMICPVWARTCKTTLVLIS